jgi:hypothetical protein
MLMEGSLLNIALRITGILIVLLGAFSIWWEARVYEYMLPQHVLMVKGIIALLCAVTILIAALVRFSANTTPMTIVTGTLVGSLALCILDPGRFGVEISTFAASILVIMGGSAIGVLPHRVRH